MEKKYYPSMNFCEYDVKDLHHETVDERQRDMRYSMFAHFQHEILFGF